MSYSRANELVADSLGYVLATNAGFHSEEAFVALEVLDASDQLRYLDTLPLQTIFDFNKFKFKSYWLNTDNSSISSLVVSSKDAFPDSLKSHPIAMKELKSLCCKYHHAIVPFIRTSLSVMTLKPSMIWFRLKHWVL